MRDSYATTDFESVDFKQKQITGQDFYDRNSLSRKVGVAGLGLVALFGSLCIVEGYLIFVSKNTISSGIVVVSLANSWEKELLCLGLNLMVTACTEAAGFVHGIALRSALSSERRLLFNTNLRLLSAARGWLNPNGTLCNIMMAILLIISYGSSLLVTLSIHLEPSSGGTDVAGLAICVSEVPLIVLGVALLLQAILALASVRSADVLTWSSSPFDITAALVHHAQVVPELGRCMYGVGDDRRRGPVAPSLEQSSAWRAHRSIRKVIATLWVLVVACVAWGLIVVRFADRSIPHAFRSWTFLPQAQSHVIAYSIPVVGGVHWQWYWLLYYVNMAAIQGPLTLALHCSELVVNVIRDETVWRKATRESGTTISSHPLALVFGIPLNVVLLLSKPVLHWMLGLAISLAGTAEGGLLKAIAVSMWPMQILNYSGALLIFSLGLTVVAMHRPRGPQPAAYGHVQTLANLIDEWSLTMWWGHKSASIPYHHAGTSDGRLGKVDVKALYA